MSETSFTSIGHKKYKIKKKIQYFIEKHDFSKNFSKNSKIHFLELRNPVGSVPHAFLALNQWIRPKNKGGIKTVPQTCKSLEARYLKRVQ